MKVPAKPVLFKAPVSIGESEYTAHLSQCEAVPTQPTQSWTDLDGKQTNFGGESGWVLNLAGAQDYTTAEALAAFLLDHEGQEIEVTFPFSGQDWTVTAIAGAVAIGGTINTPATFSKSLPCSKPTRSAIQAG